MDTGGPLRIAVAQIACEVGSIDANAERIIDAARWWRDQESVDLVVFPELAITGYPPDDLLLRADFLAVAAAAMRRVAEQTRGIAVLLGVPRRVDGGVRNAAVLLRDGAVVTEAYKRRLPSYSVFDDNRHFTPGEGAVTAELGGRRLGLLVCEDLWFPEPAAEAAAAGAETLIGLNASPFHAGKAAERLEVVRARAVENGVPLLYVNAVGGQDEVVYDGASFAVDADGGLAARWPAFAEDQAPVGLDAGAWRDGPQAVWPGDEAAVYTALVRGTADYVRRNGFSEVVLGLSGGIDSALAAAVAVDALGAERVQAVMMPTRYTADRSLEDAEETARRLGVTYHVVPVEPLFNGFSDALAEIFTGLPEDVTEENLQSRIRGNLLMALSNKFGRMLLATGNKSELAVGYATLYGDMCGGFAPLKDVYKTEVYRLARWRNAQGAVIPEPVIEREPTAELRANQRDTDTLPPYPVLDAILRRYLEDEDSEETIARDGGFDEREVERVVGLLYRNEYKRRQGAPGVKVTRRAFGRDRRYPITSGWRGLPRHWREGAK